MIKIKIQDLIDAIDMCSDFFQSVINLKTGRISVISEEAMSIVGADDDYPEWQEEEVEDVRRYLENEKDYLPLPTQYDANEYRMMECFSSSLEDEKIAAQLFICLRGKGAFRRFKDSLIIFDIDQAWYEFRGERYKQFAIQWCEENEILWD